MKKEVIEKVAALITAAFGLVAALAWNDAIKTIFTEYFGDQVGVPPMLTYALIVTALAVIAAVWSGKVASKTKK